MDHVSNGIRILEFFSHTIEAWQGDVISNVHDTADFSLAEAWMMMVTMFITHVTPVEA